SARSVLATIAALGEASAAAIAEKSGVAYSTTNKKLRLLEAADLARARRGSDTKVRWQLTDAGHAYATAHVPPAAQSTGTPAGGDTGPAAAAPAAGAAPAAAGGGVPAAAREHAERGAELVVVPHTALSGLPAGVDPPARAADAAQPARAGGGPASTGGARAATRRRKGALHHEVLTVLRGDPRATFTVAQVRKQVDAARHHGGGAAASAGAVYNALIKAVRDGEARQVAEKPATFQAV